MKYLLTLYFLMAGQLVAGQVTIVDSSTDASFSVTAYDQEYDRELAVKETKPGEFVIDIDEQTMFSQDAYRTVLVSLTWSPGEGSNTVVNEFPMSIELPVLLRAWEPVDVKIRTSYFLGIGEQSVSRYEGQWPAVNQLERMIGSLLVREYYDLTINDPLNRHSIRSTEAAMAATVRVSQTRNWFQPPTSLFDKVTNGSKTPETHIEVLQVQSSGQLKDVLLVDRLNLTCAQWVDFFEEVEAVSERFSIARKVLFPDDNLDYILLEKKKIASRDANCS